MSDPITSALAAWAAQQLADKSPSAFRMPRQRERDVPAVRAALVDVVRLGVADALTETFPDSSERQAQVRTLLFERDREAWPLVDGTGPAELPAAVAEWIARIEAPPVGGDGSALMGVEHSFSVTLSAAILARIRREALRGDRILAPMWLEFKTHTGMTFAGEHPLAFAPRPTFSNRFEDSSGRTVVQSQNIGAIHIQEGHAGQREAPTRHSFTDGPLLIGRIPALASARQERDADRDLAAALGDGGTAVVCQVLSGMGGVGKTQLAAGYARRCWDDRNVDLLVWVNSATRESIVAALADAGSRTCGVASDNSDRAADAFLAWLDGPDTPRWLIVLDDLSDPADLIGLWPPAGHRGRTVVTTRRRDAALDGTGRSRIDIDLFTPAQALGFLTDRLGGDDVLLQGARGLAADIGHLPLALAQAAAFILDQPGMTCQDFRRLVVDRAVELDRLRPDVLPDDYPHTLTTTIWLSIAKADRSFESADQASAAMRLASMLDPGGIPAALFATEPVRTYLASASSAVEATPTPTAHGVSATLARLHRLSLIDYDGETVRAHALVQRAVRDRLDPATRRGASRAAADALAAMWPGIENDPAAGVVLRANTMRLREHSGPVLFEPDAHTILFRAGRSLGDSGQVGEAAAYFKAFHAECHEILGPEHPSTLTARHNFASWLGETGDAAGACAALEKLLADRLRILGPDHPQTLATRHNLASWRGEAGDPAGAADAFAVLLIDRSRILGPDHPDTLTARLNLASWRGESGDAAAAVEAFEALLADCVRILGPDHPHTLTTRHNLASWRGEAGDPAGAADAFEDLLADCLRVLGSDHPHTLTTRIDLASWRGQAGDATGAVEAFQALLADCLRVLGPDHPHTLTTRHNLTTWQQLGNGPQPDDGGVPGASPPAPKNSRTSLFVWAGDGALALVVAAVLLILQPWRDDSGRTDSPTQVVDGYMSTTIDSMNSGESGDFEGLAADLRPFLCKEMQEELDSELEAGYGEFPAVEYNVDYTLGKETIDGDTATVSASMTGTAKAEGETFPVDQQMNIELLKEDGTWKICGDDL